MKPVKNTDKNKQCSVQKEVPSLYKLQDHSYLFIYLFIYLFYLFIIHLQLTNLQ